MRMNRIVLGYSAGCGHSEKSLGNDYWVRASHVLYCYDDGIANSVNETYE